MMISFIRLLYNKYSNLAFKINIEIFGRPLCNVVFLAVDETAKTVRL